MPKTTDHASQHPTWCDWPHQTSWQVHAADVGTVQLGEQHSYDVGVTDYSDSRGAHIELIEWEGNDQTVTPLTAAQARELSRHLADAADLLDPAGAGQ